MPFALLAVGFCDLFITSLIAISRNKRSTHNFMAAIGFLLAYVLVYSWAAESGFIAMVPAFAGSDVAAMFAMAACVYAGFVSMIYDGKRKPKNGSALIIAGSMAAVGVIAFNALTAPAMAAEFGAVPGHFATPARRGITLAADLAMASAFVALIATAFSARTAGAFKGGGGFRYRVSAFACYLVGVVVTLSSDVFADEGVRLVGYLVSGINSILFSFAHFRVDYLGREKQASRPASMARDGSAMEFSRRLSGLMGSAAPYKNSELTLKGLAEMLGEVPQRLSNHLNTYLATSFPAYVNGWRLKAVCHDLAARPDRSILDIAFDNGFNSKSNFNSLFFKAFGKTPRQFRQGTAVDKKGTLPGYDAVRNAPTMGRSRGRRKATGISASS